MECLFEITSAIPASSNLMTVKVTNGVKGEFFFIIMDTKKFWTWTFLFAVTLFWNKNIIIFIMNFFYVLFCIIFARKAKKMDIIFVIHIVIWELILSKNVNNKKMCFNEKQIEKDSDDFWHKKMTLKVKFWHFLKPPNFQNSIIALEYVDH